MPANNNRLISEETRQWLNAIYNGVYIVDQDMKILFWNDGAERITGYTADEMTGATCRNGLMDMKNEKGEMLHPKADQLREVMRHGRHTRFRLYMQHKQGHRIPVSTHITPIKDSEGNPIGAIEIFRDTSAEEKIHQIEERFKRVIRQYVSETTYKEVIRAVNHEGYNVRAYNRNLTILFMDIVNFTGMSEKQEPEQVVEMLNAYFTHTSRIIQNHTGDIDKFLGDGVMALFMNPQDAINASLDMMQHGLHKLNQELRSLELPAIDLRIGINTGNLIQGNIGSEDRKDWTVVGDVVNTAYRIEESADPGKILISESTIRELKNPDQFSYVKEMNLRGKSRPIKVYSPKN
jgi:PAS domain S-box-containing protein